MKTIIVLPAYNAAKTLKRTLQDIPPGLADEILLVDDASQDDTAKIAREMGLRVLCHENNKGYGANQKTCYAEALRLGADIIVMLHPDYQYDPAIIPHLIEPIRQGRADAVFGSRMMKGGALKGGMPIWKYGFNILLTGFCNWVLGRKLTEYHSGFRAYSRRLLTSVRFKENSDDFVFDTQIIVQIEAARFPIEEIPIQTRYFDEASTIKFIPCVHYGLGILGEMLRYKLHTSGIRKEPRFEKINAQAGVRE